MDSYFTKKRKVMLKRGFSLLLAAVVAFGTPSYSGGIVSAAQEQETEGCSSEALEKDTDIEALETDVEQPAKEEQTEEQQIVEERKTEEETTEQTQEINTEEETKETLPTEPETEEDVQISLTAQQDDAPLLFTFCGTEVRGSMSGSGWTYEDKENEGILTLDNFCLTDSDVNFMRTNFSKDLTILLKGDNVVQTSGGFWSGLPYPDYVTITGEAGATLSFQSLEEGGFCLFQNVTIKDGVTVNFDTGQHVMLDDDLVIDNAQMNVQCNGKLSYLYVIHGSLEVKNNSTLNVSNSTSDAACCIYMHKHMSVTDSKVSAINPNPGGLGIYIYYSSSNPDAARDITLTNSEVTATGGVAGVHCDRMTINKSALTSSADSKLTARVKYGEVVPDTDSHIEGIVASYYGKDDDKPTVYDVYGETTLLNDLNIAADESFHIPRDTKLIIPEGVTLTNEGRLHIYDSMRLDGAGTLTGSGNYDIDVAADLIDIPDSLCYTGKELNDKITLQDSLEIMGQTFTADIAGWTLDTATLGTVKEVGDYTAKYTKDGQSIEKTFTVGMSATDISAKTYNGNKETDTFTVDDTITVKAVPTATGKAPEASSARIARRGVPTSGQMALFLEDAQISEAASAQADGSYTMTVNASDALADKTPNGDPITLTAKFITNSNMADAETTVEVKITAAAKVKTDSGITYYGTIEKAWTAAKGGTPATVTLLDNAEITTPLLIQDNDNITFDGGAFTLSAINNNTFKATGGKLTILGGKIKGNTCVYVSNAEVTINDGTFLGGAERGHYGVYAVDGSTVIIKKGLFEGYSGALYLYKTAVATLSGGTFSGELYVIRIDKSDLTLGNLLGHTDTIRYAYYNASGLVTNALGKEVLYDAVTIKECTHDYSYKHTKGTTVHNVSCPACGEQKADESCSYTGFDTETKETCVCGSTLAVALSGTNDLVYDGKEKKPEVTVTLDGEELAAEHYSVTYTDNINAGTAVIMLTGKDTYSFQEKVKFKIAPKPVTISGVRLKDRDYNGEKTVAVEQITLSGVVGTEDVAVDLDGVQGTLSSADAGTYTSVILPELILTGTAKENYTLVQPTESIAASVTINPLDAEITVGTGTYSKIFGDAAFSLDVTGTNLEADIQCEVTKGEDVISVSGKTVTIQNAGEAEITVSIPETTNYHAAESKVIIVTVAKKSGYTVDVIERSYFYLEESTDTIDLAELLPEDCKTVTYHTPSTSGNVLFKTVDINSDGTLSYTLETGNVNDEGIITTVIETQNYEDITITVNVKRTNCDHVKGEDVLYAETGEKAPTCTEDGLGHRECIKCGFVMETGVVVAALGHDYTSEVTKEPTADEEGVRTYTCSRCGDTYTEVIPKETPEGLWISGLTSSITYTGSAIKPNVKVYHGSTLLREKTEYTISYKKNTNAGAAQVIVSGKGNYKGKATAEFTIEAIDISTNSGISATVATVAETGKNLKPVVTVTWNGKKLKEKKDYTLSYDTNIKTASADGYDITIKGTGNFTGSVIRKFHVAPKGTPLLNSAKVTGIAKSYQYPSGETQGNPDIKPVGLEEALAKMTVKVGKETLTKGTHYTVRLETVNAVGTGTIVLEPTQTSVYAGEKRISIGITGTDLKKGSITGLEKVYPYTGKAVEPEIKVYSGKKGSGTQILQDAYTVRYSNQENQGKATVTVTGIPEKGYSGSISASYTIGKLDIGIGKTDGSITVKMPDDIQYAKGGAKPQPVITYTNNGVIQTLREDVDYQLKYSNNTAVSGKKEPILKITGIGNYCGTVTERYGIAKQDIAKLTITAADKAYNSKKKGSYYYSVPKVYDLDGKQLKSKTDYTVQYFDAATGQEIGKNDTVVSGVKIRVTVTAAENSNYTGTLSTTYFVRDAKDVKDIAKTKFDKIEPQQYTGSEIKPDFKLYTMMGKTKVDLTKGTDYEIIGYYNNIKKGTATVLIRGINDYSGVKSVTFKIAAADNSLIWSGISRLKLHTGF